VTVRSIKVWHTDTLEVIWQFEDGTSFREHLTVSPKEVREAKAAAGHVLDSMTETSSKQKM
jgi:hypothetical protein